MIKRSKNHGELKNRSKPHIYFTVTGGFWIVENWHKSVSSVSIQRVILLARTMA